jgi:hypothetical protein
LLSFDINANGTIISAGSELVTKKGEDDEAMLLFWYVAF